MTKIIGIIGHSGVGKDTFGKFLFDAIPMPGTYLNLIAFADHLRSICAVISGLPTIYFSDQFYKNTRRKDLRGKTPKEFMQEVGTKLREVDKDIFVNYVKDNYIDWQHDEFMIITDVRLQNEIDFVLANEGVLIHLTRKGYDGKVNGELHESEKLADELLINKLPGVIYVENNGTLSDLQQVAKQLSDKILSSL